MHSNDSGIQKRYCSIAVAINVYEEPLIQVEECFTRITNNLPGAKVAIFLDGVNRPDVAEIARRLKYLTIMGSNYGNNSTWNLWWQRMLYFFDWADAKICFKFDPDTMVDAPPESIPNVHYFGSVEYDYIQGGVVGLSGELVRTILRKNLLHPSSHEPRHWLKLEDPHFADDKAFALMLRHIGIYPEQWPECRSVWKFPIVNDPVTHAVVHPRYYPAG